MSWLTRVLGSAGAARTPAAEDPLRKELASLDPNLLTPIDALKKLADLSERARKRKE